MLTAAGVTCSASAAAAKLSRVATASNTRSAFNGSRSKLRVGSVFLTRRSDIAFAARAQRINTAHQGSHEELSHEHYQDRCVTHRAAADRCRVPGSRLRRAAARGALPERRRERARFG